MFDRYTGKTDTPPDQRLCFGDDGKALVLPALNISSFLGATNTDSAAKMFLDIRKYKRTAKALVAFTSIDPMLIPIMRDGEPILFNGFVDDVDEAAGVYVHHAVARLKDGIPNEKHRPTIRLPWSVSFELVMMPNDVFSEQLVVNLFEQGGVAIGLGTFRGVFGKFLVDKWE
jgi:hypothetical protein